jgi:hypothetical protein
MKIKINGEHLLQLDQGMKVHLYRIEEVDELPVPFVCCEAAYGFFFIPDNRKDTWVPAIFTVWQARYRISQSWLSSSRFYVEEV